jgi:hypothetical protein
MFNKKNYKGGKCFAKFDEETGEWIKQKKTPAEGVNSRRLLSNYASNIRDI